MFYKPKWEDLDIFSQKLAIGTFDVHAYLEDVFDKKVRNLEIGEDIEHFYTLVLPKNVFKDFIEHACVRHYAKLWFGSDPRVVSAGIIFIGGRWVVTEEVALQLTKEKT